MIKIPFSGLSSPRKFTFSGIVKSSGCVLDLMSETKLLAFFFCVVFVLNNFVPKVSVKEQMNQTLSTPNSLVVQLNLSFSFKHTL